MENSLVAATFGLAMLVSTVGFPLPQMVRLLRTGEVAGVSFAAVLNCAISDTAWTVLALQIGDGWLIVGFAVAVPGSLVSAIYMWRKSGGTVSWFLPACWLAILVAAAVADYLAQIPIFDSVVSFSLLWLVLPALWLAWRSSNVSGIDFRSWYALATQGLLCVGYGVFAGQTVSTIFGTVGVVGATLILTRVQVAPRFWERYAEVPRYSVRRIAPV
ncbi:MAG: hypothetical protein ACOYD0_10515 [Candidatus Nanopelagicales bacterium]